VAWMSCRTFRSPTKLPAVIVRDWTRITDVNRDNCRNQAIALIEATLPQSPSGLVGRRSSYLCGTVARASLAYEPRSLHSQPYARQRPSGV